MSNKTNISQPALLNKWKLLTKHTNLVFLLYSHRDSGGSSDPAKKLGYEQASPQILNVLQKEGLINLNMEGKWELDQILVDFIDALSGISGDANVQAIHGDLQTLNIDIQHYLQAKREDSDTEKYFRAIRNDLQKILRKIRGCLENVDFTIKDTYIGETNLNLKTQILKENRETLDALEFEVRDPAHGILSAIQQEPAFNDESDERMHSLKIAFLWTFSGFYGTRKSAILRRIGYYLDRIEKVDKPARKIQVIYELYSKSKLRHFSNIVKHEEEFFPPFQKPRNLPLSLERDLYQTDNPIIPLAIRGLDIETGEVVAEASVVSLHDVTAVQPPITVTYSFFAEVHRIFDEYKKEASPDKLLAEFIIGYNRFENETPFHNRVTFFLETLNLFRKELNVLGTYTEYTHNDESYRCIDVIKK